MEIITAQHIALIMIFALLIICLIMQQMRINIMDERIDFWKKELSEQEEINETLKNEIKYLTKVNKTFSDGLDHFIKKSKGL